MTALPYAPLILLPAVLIAAQLDPALTPHKAPKPTLPKIDRNACPFEGCQFGQWRARERIQLFSTWESGRKPIRTLRKGESVTAVTGIYITFEPTQIEVTAPIPEYGLRPGDMVLGYMNIGEGFFNAWLKGNWIEEFDGSGIVTPDGSGCRGKCNAKLVKPGRGQWWVEVKTKDGVIGWTRDGNKFDGSDALAAPSCSREEISGPPSSRTASSTPSA